jgi:hypothetical protein
MSKTKIAVVCTTINKPYFIASYLQIAEHEINKNLEISFFIIGDKKTPEKFIDDFFDKLRNIFKSTIIYRSVEEQEHLINKNHYIKNLRWNNDERRMLGYFQAYKNDYDYIISIDDDNYPLNEYYYLNHINQNNNAIFSSKKQSELDEFETDGITWFNPFQLLHKNTIYPRGFLYSQREFLAYQNKTDEFDYPLINPFFNKLVCNQGLNTGQLDVDAATLLIKEETCYQNDSKIILDVTIQTMTNNQVVLLKNQYMPINSQNTCFAKEIFPALFWWPMKKDIKYYFDRFGDIYMGMIVKKIADAHNYGVTVGHPFADHIRNKHDVKQDLQKELLCYQFQEYLFTELQQLELSKHDSVLQTMFELNQQLTNNNIRNSHTKNYPKFYIIYMHEALLSMDLWLKALDT